MRAFGILLALAILGETISDQSIVPLHTSNYGRIPKSVAFQRRIKENCYDRLLLLVCANYCNVSLPSEPRREIVRLLTNYSNRRAIPFSVHARANVGNGTKTQNFQPMFHNDCTKLESYAEAFVVYLIAQRQFIFEFTNSHTTSWKKQTQNFANWLNRFAYASTLPETVNASDLEEKLAKEASGENRDRHRLTALLLYSNQCPFDQQSETIDNSTRIWWSKIAESLADRMDRLAYLEMNENQGIDGWNEIFILKRLEIALDSEKCPRLILINENKIFLDYHLNSKSAKSYSNIYDNRTMDHVRLFITHSLNDRTAWIKMGSPLNDIEYTFEALELAAERKAINKKFIAIGTTGGIGVIILAISIFWGLKSSSYTGSVTQTAILALTETNPMKILATKNLKRHSSM